ncbi:MAG: hypothetical protein ABI562_02845, partial [Chloroflexota bacterium]
MARAHEPTRASQDVAPAPPRAPTPAPAPDRAPAPPRATPTPAIGRSVREVPVDERPRERLAMRGVGGLTAAELI